VNDQDIHQPVEEVHEAHVALREPLADLASQCRVPGRVMPLPSAPPSPRSKPVLELKGRLPLVDPRHASLLVGSLAEVGRPALHNLSPVVRAVKLARSRL